MTTATSPTPSSRPPQKRWSAAEFDRLVEIGAFDGQRVELINGDLLEMPPMNDAHAHAVRLAQYVLLQVFPPTEWTISVQNPMRLPSGARPQPDLAVIWGKPRDVAMHPTTAALVIEIADTTLEFDRTEKAVLYALNLLPEYWIVNLQSRCVEVRRRPVVQQGIGRYEMFESVSEQQQITPLAASAASIKVAELLP